MALSNSGLSDKIKQEIIAKKGAPEDASKLQDWCDAVAKAIVEYITANAVVNVPTQPPGTIS